jgi:MFS family permease
MFDSMDFLIYVLAIGRLKSYFGFGDATAGLLGTLTLVSAAVGGLSFGVIADRIGRVKALNITILIYSVCSLGAATAQSVVQLAIWRALLGLGMGGEWASGAVLVAESIRPELRNRATSAMQSTWALGAILAAVLASRLLLGYQAWPARSPSADFRVLHAVGGTSRSRRSGASRASREDESVSRVVRRRASQAHAARVFLARLPNLLPPRADPKGGAGMTGKVDGLADPDSGRCLHWISLIRPLADRFGQRVYSWRSCARPRSGARVRGASCHPTLLLLLSPVLGCAGNAYWTPAPTCPSSSRPRSRQLSELRIASGRLLGALAPYGPACSRRSRTSESFGLSLTSMFYLGAAAVVFVARSESAALN